MWGIVRKQVRKGWRLLHCLRATLKRSLALMLLLWLFVFAFLASWCFYWFERRGGDPIYSSYPNALEGIIILIFSGFDLPNMPVTIGGLISAIVVMISGVAFSL